jgi:hypothetical protein
MIKKKLTKLRLSKSSSNNKVLKLVNRIKKLQLINHRKNNNNNIPIQYSSRKKSSMQRSSNYVIAIPSYNRAGIIQNKTLAILHQHSIPSKNIHIFVSDQDQYQLYKHNIPETLYGKLIIGVKGLKNQRNFINDYYDEGNNIVEMDDDIEKIMELVLDSDVKKVVPLVNLDIFIKNAFRICRKHNIFLWGVYPLVNPHFMTPSITTDLRFIVGPMWGMINRHLPELKLTIDEKENSERTLQFWTVDNAVLRFNNIGIETNYYKNKGGMQNEGKNRKEEALKSVNYLHKKYPHLTKIYLGKKSGMPEIKMIRQLKTNT